MLKYTEGILIWKSCTLTTKTDFERLIFHNQVCIMWLRQLKTAIFLSAALITRKEEEDVRLVEPVPINRTLVVVFDIPTSKER